MFNLMERDYLRVVLTRELGLARAERDTAKLYGDQKYLNEQLVVIGTIQDILDKLGKT